MAQTKTRSRKKVNTQSGTGAQRLTCQMCGLAAGDPDPFNANRTVRLTIGHVVDKSKGGDD